MKARVYAYAACCTLLCVGCGESQSLEDLAALYGGPLDASIGLGQTSRKATIALDATGRGGIPCDVWSPGLDFPLVHDAHSFGKLGHVFVYAAPPELVAALHHAENPASWPPGGQFPKLSRSREYQDLFARLQALWEVEARQEEWEELCERIFRENEEQRARDVCERECWGEPLRDTPPDDRGGVRINRTRPPLHRRPGVVVRWRNGPSGARPSNRGRSRVD